MLVSLIIGGIYLVKHFNPLEEGISKIEQSHLIVREISKMPVLVLNKRNTLTFNSVVTSNSVAQLQSKLMKMSSKLRKRDKIYLVMYTPGGSVDAGLDLIETMKALPQEIVTVTLFAASMGFHIVQSMGQRLITPSGILMSHRATVEGLSGEINGELEVRLKALKTQIDYIDRQAAKRLQMDVASYQELIKDEYWVFGFEAKHHKVADKMVLIRCDKSLGGVYTKSVRSFYGKVKLTFSECPLIKAPLKVEFGKMSTYRRRKISKFFNLLYESPAIFFQEYVKTRKYLKFL